jgi:Tetratricopeptide repeat/FG-GAP-like repeat/FG-GAP repeat
MCFLVGLLVLAAAVGTEFSLSEALAKIQAQDLPGAVAMLEQITKREPANDIAWRGLGFAYLKLRKPDQAIPAYQRAREIDPKLPTPLYYLGLAYALKGDRDQAFASLAKARDTRKFDMTQVEDAPELLALKGDPRFTALRPGRKDFDNPFVEPVKILREWDGEAANGQFGWIGRKIGDVDGDGVSDIVTTAPTLNDNAGRIYVYSTKTGKLLWKADGASGDQLGSGLEGAGDTNGDGIPDVIASSPVSGYARIYSGRDGRVLLTLKAEEGGKHQFGEHVAGVGDVNHDRFGDVIVGAPEHSEGRAYVYSGKDGRLLLTLHGERAGDKFGNAVAGSSSRKHVFLIVGAPKAGPRKTGRVYVYDGLSQKPAFIIDSDETGAALGGMFLSIPGDLDADGVPDIYASDWQNNARGPSTGRVYVHSGKDGHRLFVLTGETTGEGLGTSPSPAGDVDGDGHADLIVGAWQYAREAISGGRAYLYSGKDGTLMKTFTCRVPGDTFGFDAVTMGDVDGDGTVDFLISSAWSGVSGFHSGRVFLISSGVNREQ